MRVSFESGREMTSARGACAAAVTSSLQQPVPAMVTVVSLLRQSPCGTSVPGAVPDPGCFCFGGIAYWPTPSTLFESASAGAAELSDDVFVNVQTTSWLDV